MTLFGETGLQEAIFDPPETRKNHNTFHLVNPCIEIVDYSLGTNEGEVVTGRCKALGNTIQFWSEAVRLHPQEPLMGLILHECAHAFLHAVNGPGHEKEKISEGTKDDHEAETEVSFLLEQWGLSEYEEVLTNWELSTDRLRNAFDREQRELAELLDQRGKQLENQK